MSRKMISIIVGALLLISLLGIGYYFRTQKSAEIEERGVSCEKLKDIPSAEYAPEEVREEFMKCFPERADGGAATTPASAGPSCDELEKIPSSQYAPPQYRDKFEECFPERP